MIAFGVTHVLAPTEMGEADRDAIGYARLFADHFAATSKTREDRELVAAR